MDFVIQRDVLIAKSRTVNKRMSLILITLTGIKTWVRPQVLNALPPMLVIVLGNATLVKPHPEPNAKSPMLVTPLERV